MEQPQRRIYSESVRNPLRFQQRVINQFNSPENYDYLFHLFEKTVYDNNKKFLLKTLWGDMQMFAAGDGPIYDFTDSDNIANRIGLKSALDLWSEIRRLNLIFYNMRMEYLSKNVTNSGLQIPPPKPQNWKHDLRRMEDAQNLTPTIRDGISEDNESYEMRMFISDSLQPPGVEYLNGPGPKYELLEDQNTWIRTQEFEPLSGNNPLSGKNSNIKNSNENNRKNNFTVNSNKKTVTFSNSDQFSNLNSDQFNNLNSDQFSTKDWNINAENIQELTIADVYDDIPWSAGNPNRSAEQAIAEYWGDNHTSSDTIIGSTEFAGVKNGDLYAWGPNWKKNGGSSFMRYPTIPFWQQGGREGIDYDIDETLGVGIFDSGNHVRGWSMDRLTNPKGQNYPFYGIRSGPVV